MLGGLVGNLLLLPLLLPLVDKDPDPPLGPTLSDRVETERDAGEPSFPSPV